MGYQAFYCCYNTNEVVSPEEACEMDLDIAGDRILELLQGDDDFFGLIDENDTTLQFLRNGDLIWMEIPIPDQKGSFGKHIPIDEVGSLIAGLPARIDLNDFPEMEFQPW
ncbi:hypothetical protein Pan153_00440 [Gimesia panareensis]|uniref:Uncharacterized protein n=1 Tax=Gimesia panareensis TaxID=2527978 RepID=A0A518FGK3_9PLAN|nr:hypothetical protein [Gimesia panareensis]QDV15430.1 hypothetical protein Pan153_00440 [Gimesia panareensis]